MLLSVLRLARASGDEGCGRSVQSFVVEINLPPDDATQMDPIPGYLKLYSGGQTIQWRERLVVGFPMCNPVDMDVDASRAAVGN